MIESFKDLTIITITFNNIPELLATYDSLQPLLDNGATSVVINGGREIDNSIIPKSQLLNEPDRGIYDALNKGIKLTRTKNVIFVHSGDRLVSEANFKILYKEIVLHDYDVVFGSTIISGEGRFRRFSSRLWRPWMLRCYTQPPHLSSIYKTEIFRNRLFNDRLKIVGDFYFFRDLFNDDPKYMTTNIELIHMLPNGASSNFINVTAEFCKHERSLRPLVFLPFRLLLKILMMR